MTQSSIPVVCQVPVRGMTIIEIGPTVTFHELPAGLPLTEMRDLLQNALAHLEAHLAATTPAPEVTNEKSDGL